VADDFDIPVFRRPRRRRSFFMEAALAVESVFPHAKPMQAPASPSPEAGAPRCQHCARALQQAEGFPWVLVVGEPTDCNHAPIRCADNCGRPAVWWAGAATGYLCAVCGIAEPTNDKD